ncbi:sodium:proton antiporter [Sandaracinus amylolyticus]|uniref:Putative transmembrane protein n=1 Tax=Sandaracinus amylolyticus TaxID=927083 RepID=A0A0F6YJM8_9BACT|nr:sodium:proton antiporter [Sandaracinus amylolyticus]AKF07991.1 Putative transmembrane protein [Sandaracinus amylolyticus]
MHGLGASTPLWSVIPFALMLGGIAVLPLALSHWWESNRNRAIYTAAVSLPIALWLLFVDSHALAHSMLEYVSFLVLLGSLYVIAGGIHVSGDLEGTPGRNAGLLALGAVLANFVGTTGASMLLIRTLLRTNKQRKNNTHVPFFFILIVSNCGGLLTPLGDPPLFLGYLRGVPFTWTLGLAPYWVLAVGYLVALFWVVDRRAYALETRDTLARDRAEAVPVRVGGAINVVYLAGVIAAVFLPSPWREIVMVGMALLSLRAAPREARTANGFTWAPILEVAILFAGIFVTMVPALALLEARGDELGLGAPWQFFVVTGALSSVLDNAPTYLTFLSAAQALQLPADVVGVPATFLTAISLGAVFMGANTYIGNGPNFMVKAIAEESGYRMPLFFGYALQAIAVLVPLYVLIAMWLAW